LAEHSIQSSTAVNQSGIKESGRKMQDFLHLPIGTPNGILSKASAFIPFPHSSREF
jgi:hypothetical protein